MMLLQPISLTKFNESIHTAFIDFLIKLQGTQNAIYYKPKYK